MIRRLVCWWRGHKWVSRGMFVVNCNDDGSFVEEEWHQCERCNRWKP